MNILPASRLCFPLILSLTFSKEEICLDDSVEILEILGSSCVLGLSHEIS
jgi:hypothetical protein